MAADSTWKCFYRKAIIAVNSFINERSSGKAFESVDKWALDYESAI